MKTIGLNLGFFLLLSAVVGCNPVGYVKVDIFKDLFRNSPPILTSFTCSSTTLTEGDALSCSAVGEDTGDFTYRFSLQNTCGSAIIDADSGVISMPTTNSFVPGCTLSVEAFDGEFTSTPISLSITVANAVPTLSIADVIHPEDTMLIVDDAAVQSSEGDNGVYSLDNAATTGTKCSSVGTLSIDAVTGAVSLNAPNWVGSCNITVTYDDQKGGVVSTQFNYTATGVNDGPIISGTCGGTVNQDAAYSCSALTANDPEGDTFTWEFAPANNCGFLAINSSTGAITGTPDDDDVGPCTLAVRGTDGTSYSQIVYSRTITVNNLQPTLTITNKSTTDTIGPVIIATDAQVQSNEEGFGVYSIDNATTSGTKCSDHGSVTINSTNGEVTFDGTDGWTGTCNIKVTFDDQNPTLNLVSSQFTVTVIDSVGPVLQSVSSLLADGTYNVESTISIQVTYNEPVIVTGTPSFFVETGFIDREATYVSGSGSRYLVFNYVVQSDDASADLDVVSGAVIALNSGTMKDSSGNDAGLTLPVGADPNSLQSNKNIVIAGTYPFAELSNIPSPIARTSLTDMTVGGNGVTHYKYKWGVKGSVDCNVATGYSAETPISQKITESLTSVVVGNAVLFCAVGRNSGNVWQPYGAATRVEWIKGEYSMGPISLAGLSNLPNWKSVAIDSFGRILASNARGEIFRSVDNGVSWQLQCKMVSDSNAHFKIDPSLTGYAYYVSGGNLYKVESYNGAPCPQKTSTLPDFNYTNIYSPIALNSDGEIYIFIGDSGAARDYLYKSVDQGENWSLVTTLADKGWASSFAIDPNDKMKMFRFSSDADSTGEAGMYTSTDSGATWNLTSLYTLTWVSVQYNKNRVNSIYTSTNTYSIDGGASFSVGVASKLAVDSRPFFIDTTGAGYFLQENGANTVLRKSTDYGVSDHTPLYTFTGVNSNKNNQAIYARGNLITAVMGGRLFISTDAGVNFSQINWQGTKLGLFTGISTKDGKNVYGVTADWNIVSSGDVGETWALKYTYGNGCFGKEPRIDTHELDVNKFSVWAGATGGCPQYVTTNDGGLNYITGSLATNDFEQSRVYNPLDPDYEGFRSYTTLRETTDGGSAWRTLSGYSYINRAAPDSYLDSQNGNFIWNLDISNGFVYKVNQATKASTNVTTGMTTSGIEGFINNAGNFEVRVISRTGQVKQSTDQGATFSTMGTDPGLTTCNARYFYTLPQNRDVMASICASGDDITFTTNGGASWRTIDLDGLYGINCDASGIALHPNKFFVACKSYDVLYIKYNAIEITNEANDGIISIADHSLSKPVVNNTIANEFASTEYAIIPLNGTCDNSLTFSSIVPQTNDPIFATSGNYQVCVKLTDATSVVSFDRSPVIKADGTVPIATSLSFTGALTDSILKRHELKDDANPIVTSIIGSGYDLSSFAIIPAASSCNNSYRFSYTFPLANLKNQFVDIDNGSWKVCMRLSDRANNGQSYIESGVFTYSDTAVYADLSNLPSVISNDLSLHVTVGGTGVTEYKYKYGNANLMNCEDAAGYSSETPVGTPLAGSLLSFKPVSAENPSSLKLCVIANDGNGNWQPMKEATIYEWSLNRYAIEKISFTGAGAKVENWKSGFIDLNDPTNVYGIDVAAMVYKTVNGGNSWSTLCRLPLRTSSFVNGLVTFRQSMASDKTLYVLSIGDIFKIENKNGGDCINLTQDIVNISEAYVGSTFEIDAAGNLYANSYDYNESRESIFKSVNKGLTWKRVGGGIVDIPGSGATLSIKADPFVVGRLFATYTYSSRPDLFGIYRSDNNGKNWVLVRSVTSAHYLAPSFLTPGKWTASSMNGFSGICSSDNWVSFTPCNRFMIDSPGGTTRTQSHQDDIYTINLAPTMDKMPTYFINKFGAGINSTQDLAFRTPQLPQNAGSPTMLVEGSTVMVFGNRRMVLSMNGGKNFSILPAVNPQAMQLELNGAKDDGKYLITSTGLAYGIGQRRVYLSQNYGASWDSRFDPDEYCFSGGLRVSGDVISGNYASLMGSCGNQNFKAFSRSNVLVSSFIASDSLGTNVDDAQNEYFFGNAYMGRTASFWQSYDYKPFIFQYSYPSNIFRLSPEGFVDPRDPNQFFFLTVKWYDDINYSIRLGLANYDTGTWTDLKANSNFSIIAGIALAKDGLGGHYLYSMARDGRVERSSDYGASFSVINSTQLYDSSSCNAGRSYYVNPDNYRFQQTSCSGEAVSTDGGLSFVKISSSYATDKRDESCRILPKFFDGRNIYVQCSVGLYKMKYSDFDLAGGASDREIHSSEQNSQPLIDISEPGFFSSIGYAVVNANTICDGSLSYSSTVPTSSDPAFTTSGNYKVCIRYNDGNLRYTESSTITYTNGAAAFTSIALMNEVSDGILKENERLDSYKVLVGNLVASNYSQALYQVTESGSACSTLTDYKSNVPLVNLEDQSMQLVHGDTYKVCVKVTNSAGSAYGSSSNFTYEKNYPRAILVNELGVIEKKAVFTSAVTGIGVTHYKFKFGLAAQIQCASPLSYSAETPIGTPLSANLSTAQANVEYKFCLVGKNNLNEWQPYNLAKQYRFFVSALRMKQFKFGSFNLDNWVTATVSETDPNHIVALSDYGDVYRSKDTGATWTLMCRLPSFSYFNDSRFNLLIANDSENSTYVSAIQTLGSFQVKALDGELCPKISSHSIALDSIGNIYGLSSFIGAASPSGVYKSTDKGKTWTELTSLSTSGNNGQINVNRADPDNIIVIVNSSPNTMFETIDGGVTWMSRNTSGFSTVKPIISSPVITRAFFQPSNRVFTRNGGITVESLPSGSLPTFKNDGTAYRLMFNSIGQTVLQTNSDVYAVGGWTTISTFNNASLAETTDSLFDSLSVSGTTVATIIGRKLFISTNGGTSFTQVNMPFDRLAIASVTRSAGKLYAVTNHHAILESSDMGATWSLLKQVSFGTGRLADSLHVPPTGTGQMILSLNDAFVFTNNYFTSAVYNSAWLTSPYCYYANLADPNQGYLVSASAFASSINAFMTWATSAESISNTCSDKQNYINPANTNVVLHTVAGMLYTYNIATNTATQVVTGLVAPFSEYDFFEEGGNYVLRMSDSQGTIRESTDFGATSTQVGMTAPFSSAGIWSYNLVSDVANRDFIVNAGADVIAFSSDRANTWSALINLSTMKEVTGCDRIDELALFNDGSQKALMSCMRIGGATHAFILEF